MLKYWFLTIITSFILTFPFDIANAQNSDSGLNPQYNPASVVKRLSYENFRNIKLLRTAILNFGGGEAEMQKLIDQYADASALYFQDKVVEAAAKFTENERAIFITAKNIAAQYKKESDDFLKNGIKRNIQLNLESEIEGKGRNAVMDKYLDSAKFSLRAANAIFDDFQNVNSNRAGSANRLVTSIYYYRMAKENLFLMYLAHTDTLELDKDRKKDREIKDALMDRLIKEDFKADYQKHMQDNKNKIFTSMEKRN